METIKNLIHEIHRRSVWQVLAIFLAASWGVLQVVEVLTESAGLPDWTPTMALVALLIGLPICLATAFVQEGMPGRQAGETDTPEEAPRQPDAGEPSLAGGTGSLDRPSTRPSRTSRLFTWRNALLGGVGIFVLLGLSLAANFVMWSTGIGPVGNLVAQGVITEGERVVLATFDDATDEGLGNVVTDALRIDLLQGSILDPVEESELAPVRRRMEVEPGSALTAELAREAAVRDGIAAVIDGEVAAAGSGYIITATLRAAESGQSLAAFRVTAKDADDVIRSIEQLSHGIREKSGESLGSIRAGKPLEQVTTTSLEALKLYSEAVLASNEMGDAERGAMLLERALLKDSTFAMAWRQLGIALDGGRGPARREEAVANAFRYRDRLQDVERYVIEALYFTVVAWDVPAVIAAYQNALLIDPDETRAINNLALHYSRDLHDWESAEPLLLRAVSGPGVSTQAFNGLIRTQIFLGKIAEARSSMLEFEDTYPDGRGAERWRPYVSFAEGDLEATADHARQMLEDTSLPAFTRAEGAMNLALIAQWSGQLDQSRQLRLSAEDLARQANLTTGWTTRVRTAYDEALLGEPGWALQHLREGIEGELSALPARTHRERIRSSVVFAFVDAPETTEQMVQDSEESIRSEWKGKTWRAETERALLFARVVRGDSANIEEAFDRLTLESGCRDTCWLFDQAWLHDRLGQREQAIALYERVRQQGFIFRSAQANQSEILHAMIRLGPLYDELGKSAEAIEAYQRMVDQWADGDARGQETVQRFRERITALGG
jgi:tetratricopeptide (TPR) repeat protein